MLGFGSSQIPTDDDALKYRKAHEILTCKNSSQGKLFINQVLTLSNGSQLSYSQVGDINGIPTIFFQGPTANRHLIALYDEICTQLGIKLFCFDRPGRGASTPLRNPKEWSFASWGDYVLEATELLGIYKFYIVAHSFGCSYVLASWPKLSSRVLGGLRFLATWAPSNLPCMPTSYALQRSIPTKFLRALTSLSKSSTLSSLSYQVVPGQMGNIGAREKECLNDTFQKEVLEKVGAEHLHDSYNAYELDWLLALETTKPLGYEHRNLDCSIKCWHGMDDSITPLGAAMWMQREMSHFLLFAVEGATHNIHLDSAIMKAIFADIKADYINSQAALEKARQESEKLTSAENTIVDKIDYCYDNDTSELDLKPSNIVSDELVENVW